jgi:hypothetical protein
MNAPTLLSVTPMIPAGASLAEELRFYTERLGFEVPCQAGDMAGIRRGQAAFNLIENTERLWAENSSFSIGTDDLDALYEEYRRAIGARVGSLEMKAWGRREFHMVVPSGVCLQFYQQT